MSYMFPEMKTVKENTLEFAVCKLAEEVGEVAEVICKRNGYIMDEVMDVMQCCENILRKLYVSDDFYDELVMRHIEHERGRGYYA